MISRSNATALGIQVFRRYHGLASLQLRAVATKPGERSSSVWTNYHYTTVPTSLLRSASNVVGESNATSVIDLTLANDRPSIKISNNRNVSLTLQQSDADDVARDAINVTVVCKVQCIGCYGGEIVKVRWHFNGVVVKVEEGTLNSDEAVVAFYLILTSLSTTTRGNTVICDTMVYWKSSRSVYRGSVVIEVPNSHGNLLLPSKRPMETSAFTPSHSLMTNSVSVQDNITDMKTLGNHFILVTTLGITGSVFLTICLFVVGVVVMYRIIRAKAGLSSDAVKENLSDTSNTSDESQKQNAVNNDSDYEEPLQSMNRRCFHHYSRPDDVSSHYEMNMLGARFSMISQGTSADTTSSDSVECYNMSGDHPRESYSSS